MAHSNSAREVDRPGQFAKLPAPVYIVSVSRSCNPVFRNLQVELASAEHDLATFMSHGGDLSSTRPSVALHAAMQLIKSFGSRLIMMNSQGLSIDRITCSVPYDQ